jgi:hypothetical protein
LEDGEETEEEILQTDDEHIPEPDLAINLNDFHAEDDCAGWLDDELIGVGCDPILRSSFRNVFSRAGNENDEVTTREVHAQWWEDQASMSCCALEKCLGPLTPRIGQRGIREPHETTRTIEYQIGEPYTPTASITLETNEPRTPAECFIPDEYPPLPPLTPFIECHRPRTPDCTSDDGQHEHDILQDTLELRANAECGSTNEHWDRVDDPDIPPDVYAAYLSRPLQNLKPRIETERI